MARRLSSVCAGTFALALYAGPALAQYGTTNPDAQPNNYPPALPARRGPGPVLVFERLGEIALPGPLGTPPGWVDGERVVIPVAGGFARVAPETGETPSIVAAAAPPEAIEWVVSPDGKRRFRTTPEGIVDAQRRARGRKVRWKTAWRIVAPNSILAPPVLIGARLCYAGLDDRVTCVRASNGHRLWAVDLGNRLSRGLACWPACGDGTGEGHLVLAVPDDGASIVALDAYDGRRVASFELPATHHFASRALVVTRDRIAIARKGYDDKEAALVLLRLVPPPPPPAGPPAAVPYNEPSPARTGSSGR